MPGKFVNLEDVGLQNGSSQLKRASLVGQPIKNYCRPGKGLAY